MWKILLRFFLLSIVIEQLKKSFFNYSVRKQIIFYLMAKDHPNSITSMTDNLNEEFK